MPGSGVIFIRSHKSYLYFTLLLSIYLYAIDMFREQVGGSVIPYLRFNFKTNSPK